MVRRKHKKNARLWLPPLTSLLLAMIVQHSNQMLASAGSSFWIHVDALFLVFPLFYLRFAHGLPQTVFVALALGAFSPLPFGTELVIYLAVLVVMTPWRVRIRRENPGHVFWLALFMEALCYGGEWIAAGILGLSAPLSRILTDLVLSSLFCGMAAFWWMELQRRAIITVSGEDPAGYPILY
jgi:hypothetical protein